MPNESNDSAMLKFSASCGRRRPAARYLLLWLAAGGEDADEMLAGWLSGVLGLLIVTPAILIWFAPANGKRHRFPVDAVLLFIGLALMCAAMFFVNAFSDLTKAWSYLFPRRLCIAVRSGIESAALGDPLDHFVFIDGQPRLRSVPRPRSNAWLLARVYFSRGFSPDQPRRRDPGRRTPVVATSARPERTTADRNGGKSSRRRHPCRWQSVDGQYRGRANHRFRPRRNASDGRVVPTTPQQEQHESWQRPKHSEGELSRPERIAITRKDGQRRWVEVNCFSSGPLEIWLLTT